MAVLRWTEHLLVVLGCVLLGAAALFIAQGVLEQRSARDAFRAARDGAPTRHTQSVAPPVAVVAPRAVRRGAPIAELSIPRVGLSTIVLEGSDSATLRRGPGHVETTPLPGGSGNVAIAGHRDSFFRPLQRIQIGDEISLDTLSGRFQYRVASLRIVHADDLSVIQPTRDPALTLITCYPFWVLGNAPDRFVVRAERVEAASGADAADRTYPDRLRRMFETDIPPATTRDAERKTAVIIDDAALVRGVIERFRVTYNARLASRDEGPPLSRQTCDVVITEDGSTARCRSSSPRPDDVDKQVRLFTLARTNDGWAIRSIVVGFESAN